MNIQKNILLSSFSTFGIGGKVDSFIQANTPEELVEAVSDAQKKHLSYRVFAGGSNVVFPDEGLNNLLIQVKGGKCAVNMREITADAGVLLSDLVVKSIETGLSGLQSLSGIPGTVGGAVVGNAGAYGHSISEVVEKVEIAEVSNSASSLRSQNLSAHVSKGSLLEPARKSLLPANSESDLVRRWVTKDECEFSYRESVFKRKPYLVLRVICKFQQGNVDQLRIISEEIITLRQKKYKPGLKCPGSFFKNVLVKEVDKKSLDRVDQSVIIDGKIPAGYLLSEVGARGMKVGGIEIADFHGNLFINKGGGTARDVKELAKILREKVREEFGIELEEEIRYF